MAAPASRAQPSTRDRLIDAAFAVVAREGLEAASVKTIAAKAGITPGLVHYHFATKETMLEAALRRGLDDYLARNRARRLSTPAAEQISAFFAAARKSIEPDRDFFKVRLAMAARAMTDPALATIIAEISAAAAEEVAHVFAAAQGLSTPEPRHRHLAAFVKGSFDGIMLAWINDPAFPIEQAGDHLQQLVTDALR